MKFETINGMQTITENGKIIMWVLTTCNGKWCYDVVGAKTDVKPVETYGDALDAALDDWMDLQVHAAHVAIVAMLMVFHYFLTVCN